MWRGGDEYNVDNVDDDVDNVDDDNVYNEDNVNNVGLATPPPTSSRGRAFLEFLRENSPLEESETDFHLLRYQLVSLL